MILNLVRTSQRWGDEPSGYKSWQTTDIDSLGRPMTWDSAALGDDNIRDAVDFYVSTPNTRTEPIRSAFQTSPRGGRAEMPRDNADRRRCDPTRNGINRFTMLVDQPPVLVEHVLRIGVTNPPPTPLQRGSASDRGPPWFNGFPNSNALGRSGRIRVDPGSHEDPQADNLSGDSRG